MRFIRLLINFCGILLVIAFASYFAFLYRGDISMETLMAKYRHENSATFSYDVDADGEIKQNIHYRYIKSDDPDTKTTLLFVHGYSASTHTWDAWIADLKKDHHIIAMDLPGHGLSNAPDLPKGMTYGIPYFSTAVLETLDFLREYQLGDDARVVIVGSSMGGNTAWQFTLDHPDYVEGLVLVGASGWPKEIKAGEEEAISTPPLYLLDVPVLGWMIKHADSRRFFESGLKNSFVDPDFVTDEMIDRYYDLARAPGHRDVLLNIQTTAREYATKDKMRHIQVPTYIIHGTEDKLVPVIAGDKFAQNIPVATLTLYGNVGHLPHEEIADRSLEHFRDWLKHRPQYLY